KEYCANIDGYLSPETEAVYSNIFGNYLAALEKASEHRKSMGSKESLHLPDSFLIPQIIDQIKNELESGRLSGQEKISSEVALELLERPLNPIEFLDGSQCFSAKEYIVQAARNYHYTLINEAHYSSQHRKFTTTLVQPLWDIGYRYLALEALSSKDTDLVERGYPLKTSGYYINDPTFGEMLRKALKIGYKVIAYDSSIGTDENLRDSTQAERIYAQTYAKDHLGKVLVHAGYGHIWETGDSHYSPMGAKLKGIFGMDILTIDQEQMTPYLEGKLSHPYWLSANKIFNFERPIVLVDSAGNSVLSSTCLGSIDIQVYHPGTVFINGRPNWLIDSCHRFYTVPNELQKYTGKLLKIVSDNESIDAVPVDQIVIGSLEKLLVEPGEYVAHLVDCNGILISSYPIVFN
ncbi:MAG: hypothetical protein KDC53_15155, partial [Saprospiraceae bacterium]|nr:hypothetical protein [Saprospiraceae bacterium]